MSETSSDPNALLHRLVALDRSTTPLLDQLSEASKIVELQLDRIPILYSPTETQQRSPKARPIDEWVLRWLLKKLTVTGASVNSESPLLEPRIWLLLRKLSARVPLAMLAHQLNIHKFTQIVEKTLQWLQELVKPILTGLDSDTTSDLLATAPLSGFLEANFSLVSIGMSNSDERGKFLKRKRDSPQNVEVTLAQPSKVDLILLYACICSTLRLMGELANYRANLSALEVDFAVEHMRAMLKMSPEQAAVTLGSSFLVLSQVIDAFNKLEQDQDINVFDSLISPITMLWVYRSTIQDDLTGQSSIKNFSEKCLVPVLCIVSKLRENLASIFLTQARTNVEKMLEVYVIRPARTSYIDSKGSRESRERSFRLYMKDLLKPLSTITSSELIKEDPNHSSLTALSSVPILFGICIACSPRDTPKRRIMEFPWLEAFFSQLCSCLSLFGPIAPISEIGMKRLDVLKRMLLTVRTHEIQLKSSTIEQIVIDVLGVLDSSETNAAVDWELLGICLKINADVFIVPSSSHESSQSSFSRQPNKILSSLLTKLTDLRCYTSHESQKRRAAIVSEIILPLVQAFVHARDLSVFIDIWKQNLAFSFQQMLNSSDSHLSKSFTCYVWEDELVLQEVMAVVETALNFTQIEAILQTAKEGISLSKADCQPTAVSLANIVIVDCILHGCESEINISRLSGLAQEVHNTVIDLLFSHKEDFTYGDFRLWRTLEGVTRRWSYNGWTASVPYRRVLEKAAFNVLEGLPASKKESLCDVRRHSTALSAFWFLTCLVLQRDLALDNRSFAITEISKILDAISDSLEISQKQLQSNGSSYWGPEIEQPLEPEDRSTMTLDGLLLSRQNLPIDKLILSSCVETMVFSQQVLCLLNVDLLRTFFDKLYWCSFWEERTSLRREFSWYWKRLRNSDLTKENTPISQCLLNVQSRNFFLSEQGASLDDEIFLKQRSFAIGQFLSFPLHTLDRDVRGKIANEILDQLLKKNTSSDSSLISRELNLLARITSCSSKSVVLTTNATAIWSLADYLDKGLLDRSNRLSFKSLVDNLIRQTGTTADQGPRKEFRTALYSILSDKIDKAVSLYHAPASSLLISMLAFAGRDGFNEIERTLPRLFRILNDDIANIDPDLNSLTHTSESKLWVAFLSYQTVSKLHKPKDSIQKACDEHINVIMKYLGQEEEIGAEVSFPGSLEDFRVQAKKILILVSHEKLAHEAGMLEHLRSEKAKREFMQFLIKVMIELSPREQLNCISIWTPCYQNGRKSRCYLRLLRRVLGSKHVLSDETREAKTVLSRLFFKLCLQLPHCVQLLDYLAVIQCLNTMMRTKSWAINQWHVDNILSAIAIMTSPSAPRIDGEHEREIFVGLCKLLGTLLAVHRAKMSDRYHLVVPALRGLLRCLFEPYSKGAEGPDSLMLPPWLTNRGRVSTTQSHASAYTRLLTSICDPTVSAVSRSNGKRGGDLNDETKRARNIAGQHLPYLIMDLCHCQLRGRMQPDVRQALIPGIYAVFDVMSQDRMRMVNSALDAAGREVFKVLYDDYRRFGRWQGN